MEILVLAGDRVFRPADPVVLFLYQTFLMNFSGLDWMVLVTTLVCIILYGIYKGRSSRNLEGYFLGNRQMPWWVVLLSILSLIHI